MSFTPIVVTGRFPRPDGAGWAVGRVNFRPTAEMRNTVSNDSVPMIGFDAVIGSDGTISQVVKANDDTGTVPSGTGYTVTETIIGAAPKVYEVVIPAASPGGTVDLADLAPAQTTALIGFALKSYVDGLFASGITALPAWAPSTGYLATQARLSPNGTLIVRKANGTSRSSYDATEAALWTTSGSAAYGAVVMHGTVATVARPAAPNPVNWFGTITPTNALPGDRWFDTLHELWSVLVGTIWVLEQAHRRQVAAVEEGFQSVTLGTIATPQAGGLNQTVCGNIPFHMQVTGVSLTVFANVVGSGTNFWTISLRRFRAPNQNQPPIGAGTVASVDPVFTSTVVGNGMWAGVPWDFYGVSGRSETNCELLPGDCLTAFLQTTGSPVALDRLNVTWRYKALS